VRKTGTLADESANPGSITAPRPVEFREGQDDAEPRKRPNEAPSKRRFVLRERRSSDVERKNTQQGGESRKIEASLGDKSPGGGNESRDGMETFVSERNAQQLNEERDEHKSAGDNEGPTFALKNIFNVLPVPLNDCTQGVITLLGVSPSVRCSPRLLIENYSFKPLPHNYPF
jgi:hypothetical protein